MSNLTDFIGDDFNPDDYESDSFDALPAGLYTAIIADSEMKQTKREDGHYLNLKLQIVDEGPYQNRVVFAKLNLDNPNAQAVAIAKRQFSDILRALGLERAPKDSAELHDRPLTIKLTQREWEGEKQNEVKAFKAAGAAQPATATAGASSGGRKPWEKQG